MQDETPGGQGEPLSRSDIRLIGRAVRSRWPIPDENRPEILERLMRAVRSEDDRHAIAAASTIIAADRLNLQQEAMDYEREKAQGKSELPDVIRALDESDRIAEQFDPIPADPSPETIEE